MTDVLEVGVWKIEMKTLAQYWTGLTQTPSFSAKQKLNLLIQPTTCS